ncbi:hypothetical protein niasHT_008523 [Heterodera trifolii]|uniref:Uncharacterized protein n=1 Tax=Heterodera trifolii TaxID=157864 RepID=A0ABD2MCZ1_9BILA
MDFSYKIKHPAFILGTIFFAWVGHLLLLPYEDLCGKMHHKTHRQQRQNGTNEAANLLINAVQANESLRLNGTNEAATTLLINAVKENGTAPLAPPAQPAKPMHFVVLSAVYSTKSKL